VEATERFAALMGGPEARAHPDEVALLVAAHARPGLDLAAERDALDHLADGCPAPTLDGLRAHLFHDLGFRGDDRDYHDPRNSYLDQVLRRRRGIPISLSILTIGVGRRLGVPLVGVGMPGHFLVGDRVDRDVFVDPFHRGALLDAAGCERLFQRLQGPGAPFHPSFLQPVGNFAIAARVLANLKHVFTSRRDPASLVWVLRLRSLVPGVPPEERAELAGALASTGAFGAAADAMAELASTTGGEEGTGYRVAATRLRARLN
jgi:regulator of sirC expression with transglutaminase-like and TPR domain